MSGYKKDRRRTKKKERNRAREPHQSSSADKDRSKSSSHSFEKSIEKVATLLSEFATVDAAASLLILQLWLPNRSSTVKIPLIWGILASLKPNSSARVIQTFEVFQEFCARLKNACPTFGMLEDFVPEADWGEIRVPFRGRQYRVLYGGVIERIVDFIGAFGITHASLDDFFGKEVGRRPGAELAEVLEFQHQLLTAYLAQSRSRDTVDAGHLETPSREFWDQSRQVLPSLNLHAYLSAELLRKVTIKAGSKSLQGLDAQAFSNTYYHGTWLPYLFLSIGDAYVPMSPRDATWILLEQWYAIDANARLRSRDENAATKDALRDYLRRRLPRNEGLFEEAWVVDTDDKPVMAFDAVLLGIDRVMLCRLVSGRVEGESEDLQGYVAIVDRARQALAEKDSFVLGVKKFGRLLSLGPKPSKFEIVLLLPTQSTIGGLFRDPEDLDARVMALDPFLGAIDSLRSSSGVEDYFTFVDQNKSVINPFAGAGDLLGAFADSHGVLVEGAQRPSMIMLDPHWGSQYRFKTLKARYEVMPETTPDDSLESWVTEKPKSGSLLVLRRTDRMRASSYAKWGSADVFVLADYDAVNPINGRLLDVLQECISDTFERRASTLEANGIQTALARISIHLRVKVPARDPDAYEPSQPTAPAFTNVFVAARRLEDPNGLRIQYDVDLDEVAKRLLVAKDAAFEVDILQEVLGGVVEDWADARFDAVRRALDATRSGKPRFVLNIEEALVLFPDTAPSYEAEERDFKLARREMAEIARSVQLLEGKYELQEAKEKLNSVRDGMVSLLNRRIMTLSAKQAIPFAVSQIEALQDQRWKDVGRVKQSMAHDVDYDRVRRVGEVEEAFLRSHRNVRYLIEKLVELSPDGQEALTPGRFGELNAFVDWLLVVYQASDALHYGVHPVGLRVASDSTLQVEYDAGTARHENDLKREKSEDDLSIRGVPSDAVDYPGDDQHILDELDVAFKSDFGFRARSLWALMQVLYRWPAIHEVKPATRYLATQEQIAAALTKHFADWDQAELEPILKFATMSNAGLKVLLGEDTPCGDVPVWEHTKRGQRYAITPIARVGENYCWGPYSARKALAIWQGNVRDGCLPASYEAPRSNAVVERIKRSIERALVDKADEIARRSSVFVEKELDLASRFPREGFGKELGDYDVLVYLSEVNTLVAIECKDNNPPYCLKDAGRLRKRIFGSSQGDDSHIQKVTRRHSFMNENSARVLNLLKWPGASRDTAVLSAYVTRRTYWWFRVPPYQTEVQFVRIDLLDEFLRELRHGTTH